MIQSQPGRQMLWQILLPRVAALQNMPNTMLPMQIGCGSIAKLSGRHLPPRRFLDSSNSRSCNEIFVTC